MFANRRGPVFGVVLVSLILLGSQAVGAAAVVPHAPEAAGQVTIFTKSIDHPEGIVAGPDGALWFTNSTSIGRITTAGKISTYKGSGIRGANGITSGPDGALWFTNSTGNSIGRITTSGKIQTYTGSGISDPAQITEGPDGALWFVNRGSNDLGRITTSGQISMVLAEADINDLTNGPDDALWFTTAGNLLGRITTSGKLTTYNGSLKWRTRSV